VLENSQRLHNRVITAIGNNSESNDHNQHKHSMNAKLINSAGKFASGQNLGLSEEETLALMSRELRRQKRQDDTVTMNDVERQFAQAGNSLADVSEAAEIRGVSLREEPEVDPFGQDQSDYYEYGPNDSQYGEQQQSRRQESMLDMEDRGETSQRFPTGEQKRDRYGQVVLKTGVNPNDYEDLAGDARQYSEASERGQIAPKAAVQDALNRLEGARAEQAQYSGIIDRMFGGAPTEIEGAAQVVGRLEDDLRYGPEQRDAEAALAEELNNRDRERSSSRRAAYNDVKAAIEAEGIGETMYRPSSTFPGVELPAVRADQALADIRRVGANVGAGFPLATQGTDMLFPAGDGYGGLGPAIDPASGNPVGMQGPQYVTPNSDPGSGLNAPMTTRSWMVEKQPGYSEGGRSFGNYPQADVTGATTLFANRLRQQPGLEGVSSNVRSIGELERAVGAVIGGGGSFSTMEPVVQADGRTKMVSTRQQEPDIRGVLNRMRYTPTQEAQLANSLYQMEVAANTEINQQGKQQYFTRTGPGGSLEPTTFGAQTSGGAEVYFDSPEAIDPRSGQAPVARITRDKIEGMDLGTALRKLESPEARQPFIGAVETVDRQTGQTGIESDAGPGYMTRYNSTGESDPVAIEKALRKQEQQFAQNKQRTAAKKNPNVVVRPVANQQIDEGNLRGKVVKAQLTQERANRDAKKRQSGISRVRGKNVTGQDEQGAASPIRYKTPASEVTIDRRGPMTEGVQTKLAESRVIPNIDPAMLSERGRRMRY